MANNGLKLYLDFDALFSQFNDVDNRVVCLSLRDIAVLLGAMQPSLWPSRWVDSGGDLLRDVGRLSDLQTALTYGEGLIAKITMACDLTASLEAIAQAITNKSVCCGGGSPGYVSDGAGGVWYGSEPPLDVPTTFGGEGDAFETETEFNAHRCLAANNIASGLILSLNFWSVLDLVGLTAGGLIVAFFVSNPPVALFIALAIAAGGFVILATISDYIDANRQELVCLIYNSDTYGEFLTAIDEFIDSLVISLDIGPLSVPLTELIHAALSTDVFNQAFSAVGLPPVADAVDCSVCGEGGCAGAMVTGTGDVVNGGTFTSEFENPTHEIRFYLDQDRTITINSLSGWTPYSSPLASFRIFTQGVCGGTSEAAYSSDTAPSMAYCGAYVVIFSATAFTANITIGEPC